MYTLIRPACLAFCAITFTAHAWADETPTRKISKTHNTDHELVNEIIVLSSPFSTRRSDLLTTTHVISEDEVDNHITDTLGGLVDQLPGVDQAPHGSAVGQPLIRGMGGFRIAVLENGLNNGDVFATGGDHANAISLIDQSRVELLKGAGALRYGPYATTGVINMFSRHMMPREGQVTILTAGRATGSKEDYVGLFASQTTDRFGVSGSAYYLNSGNIRIPTHAESSYLLAQEGEDAADSSQRVTNSDRSLNSFSLAGHVFGSNAQLSLMANQYEGGYGIPGHSHEEPAAPATGADHGDESVAIAIEKQTTRLTLSGAPDHWQTQYHIDFAMTNYNHAEREGAAIGTQFGQDTKEVRFELRDLPLPVGNSVVGSSWKKTDFTARGDEAYIPDTTTDLYSAYYLGRYEQAKWVSEAALRWDRQEVTAKRRQSAALSKDFNLFNFSAGLGYRLWENGLIGLSYAHTARAPSAVELFADGLHAAARRYERGAVTLDQEKSRTTEIFIRHEAENGGVDLAIFQMDYSNFIYAQDTGTQINDMPALAYHQQGAKVDGYELSMHHGLLWRDAEWTNEVTWTALRGRLHDRSAFRAMPADKLTWNGHVMWKAFDFGAQARFTKDQKRLSIGEIQTDGYQSLDLSVGWTPPRFPGLQLMAKATNVTDAEIRHHTSDLKDLIPQAGRNFRFSVRAEF